MIASGADARAWIEERFGAAARERLEAFAALLAAENAAQNLVSRASLAEVWCRHIADSAQLLDYVPRGTGAWLDLGTGAGFPGLVIAMLRPEREVMLVEARRLRAAWLERAAAALELRNARVIASRVESVPAFAAGVISARAFAPLDRLLALGARFATPATWWLLPKGASAREELTALTRWRHMFHVEHSRTDPAAGIIVGELLGAAGHASRRRA